MKAEGEDEDEGHDVGRSVDSPRSELEISKTPGTAPNMACPEAPC